MPYYAKRRYYRKRRPYRKKSSQSWLDKKYSTKDIAMSAYKSAKWLASMVNVEKKVFTKDFSSTVGTSGHISGLNQMATGDSINTRDGNSIRCKSIIVAGNCRWSGSGTDSQLRVLLIWDNQQENATDPGLASIFGSATPEQFALLNPNTLGRYTIVADKRFSMRQSNQAAANVMFKFSAKLNRHSRFSGTSASDITKNGLYIVIYSNEATNTPTVEYTTQFRYVDN